MKLAEREGFESALEQQIKDLERHGREFESPRTEIEERLTALIDSQRHGLGASKLCRTAADREFTKQVMDDLKKQIRILRSTLKALGN